MKGNEAIAEAAIRIGVDGYFGYPITPQSEVMETLMAEHPWDSTGMVVLQAESEVSSINMLYGGGGCGKKVMTSSSSPGISLMQEGLSYLAGAEVPCLVVNVVRGGPGLGTIQASQSDYFQAVKGGGHGDYNLIVLAPASVQEMADHVQLAFDLAFKYRNPAMILSDGVIGQMMEKVVLPPFKDRWTEEEIKEMSPWATTGKPKTRESNVISSLKLQSDVMEMHNHKLQSKYEQMKNEDVLYEEFNCDDAEYLVVAYGSSSRVCQKAVEIARDKGIKLGLLRPITLFPFPTKRIHELSEQVKGILSVEMSAGQMVEDVKLSVCGKVPVFHYGRLGGMVPSPGDVINAVEEKLIGGK